MRIFSAFVALSAVVISAACSDTNANTAAAAADAKPVLAAITTNVFLPSLSVLEQQALALRRSVDNWATVEPSEQTLAMAQDAWKAARLSWKLTDAFRFGPVESLRITAACDFWPTNTVSIEKVLDANEPLTAESVALLGANLRGFGAIEYFLFDNAGNAAVLAKLTGAAGARRRTYVQIASLLVHTKTVELKAAWGDGKSSGFGRDIIEAGGSSATFPSAKTAIDQIVNSAIFSAELVTNTKIGKPAGKKTGGTPQADQVESARSDNSIVEMVSALNGVWSVYVGGAAVLPTASASASSPSISSLVRAKNPDLDTRVKDALTVAMSKVAGIPQPFRTAILDHPADVEAAYQAVKSAKNIMSTEVTSVLGTALKFNDNDGD